MGTNAYRVPSDSDGETGRLATRIAAGEDIIQRISRRSIQPGVQETQRLLALASTPIVQESNDTGKNGRRGTGPSNSTKLLLELYENVVRLSRNIRVTPTSFVIQSIVRAAESVDINARDIFLERGDVEEIREATRSIREGCFWDEICPADGSYAKKDAIEKRTMHARKKVIVSQLASRRVRWIEGLAVIALGSADTAIPRSDQDADETRADFF